MDILQAMNKPNAYWLVTQLLYKGGDTYTVDNNGNTLIILAASTNNYELIHHLIDIYDLDVDAQNNHGVTAVMQAAASGYEAAIDELIGSCADLNIKDNLGETAVDYARHNNHKIIEARLIKFGAIDK